MSSEVQGHPMDSPRDGGETSVGSRLYIPTCNQSRALSCPDMHDTYLYMHSWLYNHAHHLPHPGTYTYVYALIDMNLWWKRGSRDILLES